MKEFTVCYTLDNDIKKEKIIKGLGVKKEEVVQEVLKKVESDKFFVAKSDEGDSIIHSCLVRYVRVIEEKVLGQI
ncbi:hypothetical protein [Bacillus multifaciens]|uniref:hypothetical protein n=1 Tax=Bacillus multifaciens TaxID=3068506 RepID=UPI0027420A61|nr:hypothetical protein [Bacillus sp. WLY-B-L8]MDP7979542.1 hypothetical protein [Bacillus sp. WLY-B-L8]HDX9590502.1 hypothetical protein [Bacillus pseudomycoides]